MVRQHSPELWKIPVLWPGQTVVCIGGGPSLTHADATYAVDRCDAAIGVNDAYRLGVPLSLIYAADLKWWQWHHAEVLKAYPDVPKVTVMATAKREFPGLHLLKCAQRPGWSDQPDTVHGGGHSGYQAINVAILAGARRVLLLGYDMAPGPIGETHWFGPHPDKSRQDFETWRTASIGSYRAAQARGVEIINVSLRTANTEWPIMALKDVLL